MPWPQFTEREIRWLCGLIALMVIGLMFLPPRNFPVDSVVAISRGETTVEAGNYLLRQGVIQSAPLFHLLVVIFNCDRQVPAGYYQFEKPLPIISVVARILAGKSSLNPVKVTLAEGITNQQISNILAQANLPEFNRTVFASSTKMLQGYLFPSTYFLPSHITTEEVVDILHDTFDRQLKTLELSINRSRRTVDEIVTMASIVEREASDPEDRSKIAGVLWKRYDAGERLQVDVAKETYQQSGLPAQPIANPSLEAIKATLEPTETSFWFYLSDKKGVTHYAETFAEHKKNIDKYLKN